MRPGELIFRHAEPVMGTVVSIDVRPQGLPMARTRSAVSAACELLHRADDVFSLFRPDTPLARMKRGEVALFDCPPEVAEVIEAPLATLADPATYHSEVWERMGTAHTIHFYDIAGHRIWGLTGRILYTLLELLPAE